MGAERVKSGAMIVRSRAPVAGLRAINDSTTRRKSQGFESPSR